MIPLTDHLEQSLCEVKCPRQTIVTERFRRTLLRLPFWCAIVTELSEDVLVAFDWVFVVQGAPSVLRYCANLQQFITLDSLGSS